MACVAALAWAANPSAFAGGALVPVPKSVKANPSGGVFACRARDLTGKVTFLADTKLPAEGYSAVVTKEGIRVWSSDAAGAFYAVRTLDQWAKKTYVPDPLKAAVKERAYDFELEAVEIEDAPTFRWRGFMIDEARHFLGKEAVLRQLELMAEYKLNVFHWHLVDDQGWRLDLPGHPELVKYGSVRPRSVAYGARAEWIGEEQTLRFDLDNAQYGPFFHTTEDVREILAFAKARHITVVPEIELPGHERALLAARPELSCRGAALERVPRVYWSIESDVLCAGNDETLRYLEGIFDEVCKLFSETPYIHIGGDECPKERWKECPKCQARMKELGAKDERALQTWFTRHFAEYLAKKGRRTVGWDEVLHGDVPKDVVGMSWRMSASNGAGGDFVSAADAAARGHDVVLTPAGYCYFSQTMGLAEDPYPYYGPAPYAEEAEKKKDPLTLEKAYSFDPWSFVGEKDRAHVLGVQASVWGESIFTRFDFEWKAWPRTCALAEIAWSGPKVRPFDDFRKRMAEQRRRLIARKVNCAPLGNE